MKLLSLDTTPNPNCMKLNLDEPIVETPVSLQRGKIPNSLPDAVSQLLEIEGVQEAFLASNFITLTRQGNADWQPILAVAAQLLGTAPEVTAQLLKGSEASSSAPSTGTQDLGEVAIAVLVFRGLPVQVRVLGAESQARVSVGDRFNEALQQVLHKTGANFVQERHWQPYPPRHGHPEEVAQMVAEEVASLIDDKELSHLVQAAVDTPHPDSKTPEKQSTESLAQLSSIDWRTRLRAIQQLEVNAETFPVLVETLLNDEKAAIRRWAAALLGTSERPEAINPLSEAVLNDRSVIVRRTAGDALSDLGDKRAIPTMCLALEDSSKLVRWRAARFLTEAGDETAIEVLQRAIEREQEFDVRLEMNAALERIEGGGERQLPMWMRLSQS
ncbi:MAG: virulence factor [Cyanophyceae cyanobacterium]